MCLSPAVRLALCPARACGRGRDARIASVGAMQARDRGAMSRCRAVPEAGKPRSPSWWNGAVLGFPGRANDDPVVAAQFHAISKIELLAVLVDHSVRKRHGALAEELMPEGAEHLLHVRLGFSAAWCTASRGLPGLGDLLELLAKLPGIVDS